MKVAIYLRGQTWWARYTYGGKRYRHSLDTSNKKIAEDLANDLEWRLRRGKLDPEPERVRIADYLEQFKVHSAAIKKPKTHLNDLRRIEGFLATLEVDYLHEVTPAMVTAWLSGQALARSLSPTTILRIREALHAFFEHARRHELVEGNPVSKTHRPRIPDRDPRFLSQDQILEVLAAVRGDGIEPLIATLIFAGLRRQEVCWLTWADLDLDAEPPMLRVRAKTVDGESWEPKTKRNRNVPVSQRLLPYLQAIPRRPRSKVPWVFSSPQGHRWDADNLSRRFRLLMKRAGLPWNFLDLRHTFGSQLARKNVSLAKIAKLMGNSPEIARRHYVHLIPEEMADDVEF
ncbi:MAG: site-specific integrase [Planctomycetota bacterium]